MIRNAAVSAHRLLGPSLRLNVIQSRWQQQSSVDGDKTTAKVLNQELDAGLMVDAYSQMGFRFNNGMSVVGPVAVFPKSILSWSVASCDDINEDTLSLFYMLEPKIDILVVGVGDRGNQIQPKVIQYMKNKGISLEILPTDVACSTFNFLNQERRYVAGAFIPPATIRTTEQDLVDSQTSRRQIFVSQDGQDYM